MSLDVDFLSNSSDRSMPMGYGNYKKETEVDDDLVFTEKDKQKVNKEEKEMKEVIDKYNMNCFRIIDKSKSKISLGAS